MCPEAELTREELIAIILEQRRVIASLQAQVLELQAEVARLQEELAKRGGPPSWVKRNTAPPKQQAPRKKRAKGASRHCQAVPEVTRTHVVDACPQCGRRLSGGWEASTRETLVFPREPVRVVKHVCWARRCGACGTVVVGKPDPVAHGLVGRHRVDARGMSLIAYWHTTCRMPLRTIQQQLQALWSCRLSLGALRYILDEVAERGVADYRRLRAEVRGSPVVHQDETGWREDGQNGYVWASVTEAVRYFERHGSRAGAIPREILGEEFSGVVVCDGYAGYDSLGCVLQRCWTHLLRKGHELKDRHPDAAAAHAWADGIKAIYEQARQEVATAGYAELRERARQTRRQAYERRLQAHVTPAVTSPIPEQARLAKFLLRKLNELFVFVQHPHVKSENNPAERAIRPLVIARKVCGGTRSERGSKTKMTLLSLLHTAQLRGLDPIASLEQMLLGTPLFPASA